jgi:hypothetical protein
VDDALSAEPELAHGRTMVVLADNALWLADLYGEHLRYEWPDRCTGRRIRVVTRCGSAQQRLAGASLLSNERGQWVKLSRTHILMSARSLND